MFSYNNNLTEEVIDVNEKQVTISETVTANFQKFSEYVVCVEVFQNGRSKGSFCTDVKAFDEWDDEEMIELVSSHLDQVNLDDWIKGDETITLDNGITVSYSKHWDDFYCVNVFDGEKEISSFCADRDSFEEWTESKEQLMNVIRSQTKMKI